MFIHYRIEEDGRKVAHPSCLYKRNKRGVLVMRRIQAAFTTVRRTARRIARVRSVGKLLTFPKP